MQYHPVLLRSARRLTHCDADAEDLVQDTLMHAYMGFRRFEAGTNLRAWLFRILHNRWISAYRRKQRRPNELTVDEITDSDMAGSAIHSSNAGRSAEEEALDVLLDRQIREALSALPEGFRQVVFYADVQGYTYAETASLMGIPMGTVMSRISRSRERLRTSLGATEPDAA
ncbi:MAG: sigma-70 family RNA polymerase sigma factor [Mycolicibacterium mageritense]|nr:sigma-70 family RNA polymerase sigma factor [Mycolicibacterium mageritense]TXI60827.1 MAG: sigma-70 family RNA polymerase sigma factor [Mycolicibacterium mageritense]